MRLYGIFRLQYLPNYVITKHNLFLGMDETASYGYSDNSYGQTEAGSPVEKRKRTYEDHDHDGDAGAKRSNRKLFLIVRILQQDHVYHLLLLFVETEQKFVVDHI